MPSNTPELEEVIQTIIDANLDQMNTCMPCVVESYDAAKQVVSVTPALKRKYNARTIIQLPIIENVPVKFPRAKQFSMTFPIAKGDNGTLTFSQKSLDVWKKSGGIVNPNDTRRFHLTDCFFDPGGDGSFKPIAGATTDKVRILNGSTIVEFGEDGTIDLKNNSAELKLTPDGKMKFVGSSDELLALLAEGFQTISTATVTNPETASPLPLNESVAIAAIATRINAIKAT